MKVIIDGFVFAPKNFGALAVEAKEKRNRFETDVQNSTGGKYRCVSTKDQLILLWSPWKYRCGQRTVKNGRCGMQPKAKHSLRAQAQLMRTETVETFELVKVNQNLKSRERRTREVREQALPSEYHRQTYLCKNYLFN
ncbi:hypothetical protein TNCV_4900081 [Trichonephila clavipes]|nr:hypothetical protein TNCV_4900081 [Trichonephila clavipes]